MPNSFDVRGRKLEDDELAAWLAEHSLGDRFGVTVRCADPAREPKAPVLAIVAADGDARYIDTATLTEDDEAALASWLGDPGPPKAVHDAKLVTRALARCGWALRGVTSDTAAAACLLHPEQPNSSLNELLVRHMRCALPSDHTSDTDDTEDPEEAVRALILQACAVLDLADVLDEELARIDSSSLFSELELPALRVLSEMEGSDPHDVLVAGVGYVELMTARYPAIEARVIAHLSDDAGLIGVLNAGEDPYRALASYAFPLSSDEITSQLRHRVELMFYESTASIGAEDHDLWRDLSEFLRGVIDDARRIGYCSTLLGRRRYLPDLDSDNRHAREAAERAALSLLIGGSAADIMKVAMINVHRAINDAGLTSRMVLQVDNGLVLEVAEGERETLATHLGEQLRRAYPLRAPLEVSIGYGTT